MDKTPKILNKQKKRFLGADLKRAEAFIVAKKVIDRRHRAFIDDVLQNLKASEDIRKLLTNKDDLRKKIAEAFTDDFQFNLLFGKDLFEKGSVLYSYAKNKEERDALDTLKNFSVFFSGYNENRKNMYANKKQNTAISYRIADVNLPKFTKNIECFDKIAKTPLFNQLPRDRKLRKLLHGQSLEDVFTLDYYVNVFTQFDIEQYNDIIGYLNEQIKLYNDHLKKEEQVLPKMIKLYKQILGEKSDEDDWLFKGFENNTELLMAVKDFYDVYEAEISAPLRTLLERLGTYELGMVYIRQNALSRISSSLCSSKDTIPLIMRPPKDGEDADDYVDKLRKEKKSFSINTINKKTQLNLCEYFAKHLSMYPVEDEYVEKDIFVAIEQAYSEAKDLFKALGGQSQELAGTGKEQKLKKLLDSLKELQHFIQPLLGKGDEKNKDWRFYNEFTNLWEKLSPINLIFDKVRNYMTKKPFSTEKIKVIFDVKKNFLLGWPDNQTKSDNGTQYGGYLLRTKNAIGEYDYYLGISNNFWLFRHKEGAEGAFERFDYYQLKSKVFYRYYYEDSNGEKGTDKFPKDKERLINAIMSVLERVNDPKLLETVSKGETPMALMKSIKEYSIDSNKDIYGQLIKDEEFSKINNEVTSNLKRSLLSLKFPKVREYKDKTFSVFTEVQNVIEDVCRQERIFNYFTVSDDEIKKAQKDKDKPLLLFKISNKDLSFADTYSAGKRTLRGKENLHTMYFKVLMEGGQQTFDIGSGQIFFRKKSIPQKVTHQAGVPIPNKNPNVIEKRPTRTLDYNLIKDKHYTDDKYLFHLSVKINYQQKELPTGNGLKDFIAEFNKKTLTYLREHKQDVNIIGIDRGERHLIYVSLIDSRGACVLSKDGKPIEPRSYNLIGNFDYQRKLKEVAKNRAEARKNWTTIERISDIKKGYLSQVVHEIATLAVEYHAIIVMENLTKGFKKGRFPIEHQVYQLFENMLIQKLSYLAYKSDSPSKEYGGITNGLQLAVPATNLEEYKKYGLRQNGWIFYIPAQYTSKVDPLTGFAPIINVKEAKKDIRKFFRAFDSIRFEDDLLHFIFNYDSEDIKCVATSPQREWHLTSYGHRVNSKEKEVDLTYEFKQLINKAGLLLEEVSKDTICGLSDELLSEFFYLFSMMLQMRNSNKDKDYIISPVVSAHPFIADEENSRGIKDADANGAYNIALKGLYWLNNNFPVDENGNLQYITNEEWFRFLQFQNPFL
jgi:CRISPR-associated protein Cpf1